MTTNTPEPSVFRAQCPSRQALDLVADKWTAIVLRALCTGSFRFSDLRRLIEGISQKMLTETLRNLEFNGLVQRTVYPTSPPAVEYSLTPLGESLGAPLGALCTWAEEHMTTVVEARNTGGAPALVGRVEDLESDTPGRLPVPEAT